MKRRIEFVKVMKKTTAVAMAATTAVGAVSVAAQTGVSAMEKDDYRIKDNKYFTRLTTDISGKVKLEIGFDEKDDSGRILFDEEKSNALLEGGKIKVGNGKEWTLKDAGFEIFRASRGEYTSNFKTENKEFIKTFYQEKEINITITTPEGYKVTGKAINDLSEEDMEALKESQSESAGNVHEGNASDSTSDNSSAAAEEGNGATGEGTTEEGAGGDVEAGDIGVFNTAKVNLLKSHHYDTDSMSGATMLKDAELLTDESGSKKLVIHFKPAVINGILAYATNLTLGDGNSTEFVLKSDNSAVCIVDLKNFDNNEKIIEGHIYSSIMDADVALKVSDIKKVGDNKSKLNEKIKEVKKLIAENSYYEQSLENTKAEIKKAENSSNYIEAYVSLEKSAAALREKKENPFVGDSLFHLNVIDTSVRGSSSINKYARVEINENNRPVLTVKYSPYIDFSGNNYVKSVKVFDGDKQEIPSKYELDKDKNGTLKFEMPYTPADGIFKVELTVGDESEKINSDIKMDYSTIRSGVFRELMTDAIDKINTYTHEDYSSKGNLEERKADYTESSWANYSSVLKKVQDDLKRIDLTQEDIDSNIEALKNAKENLVYNIKAGKGNTANASINGINNPENYYSDGLGFSEHPVVVKWSGSKIKFGKNGDVYRVLNNGDVEGENNEITKTGKLLIMAEDLRVKAKFTDESVDDFENATRYDKSLMRSYLNGDFYDKQFSDAEKKAILESEITTTDARESGFSVIKSGKEIKTVDKIFAPDLSMVSNSAYGYASNDSRYTGDGYALRNIMQDSMGDISTLSVKPLGRLGGYFLPNSDNMKTAPSMYIDSNRILMTLQAGKELPDTIKDVEKTENNVWQPVLKDDSKVLNISNVETDGTKVSVNYSGENIEGSTLVAAVISGENMQNGTLKSIGKVSKLLKNGKVKFDVPKFDKNADKLVLMAMDLNTEKSIASSDGKIVDMSSRDENAGAKTDAADGNKSEENISKNKSYDAPVSMMKFGTDNELSMSNGAIEKIAKVTEKDGKTMVTMKFKPMKVRGLLGHLLKMNVNGKPVKTVKSDKEGRPVEVMFEVKGNPEKIQAEVEVDIMNELAGGKSAPQNVNIVIDWEKKSNIVNNEPDTGSTAGRSGSTADEGTSGGSGNSSSGNSSSSGGNSTSGGSGNTSSGSSTSGGNGNASGGSSTVTPSKKVKTYKVPVEMKKYNSSENSMSANAVEKTVSVIDREGTKEVRMKFKPLQLRGLEGHLIKMSVEGKDVEVISRDSQGRPVEVSFKVKGNPEKVTAQVEVDVMNELAGGKSSPQKVDIAFDWKNISDEKEVEESKLPSNGATSTVAEAEKEIKYERISGQNRYETAVEISRKYFKTADNVVLASGTNYADALVSASFAKSQDAPILLTDRDRTDEKVLSEIERLKTKKVTIIGGNTSVSEKVENALKAKGITVDRIAGRNRYETSEKIADRLLKGKSSKKIVLVGGEKNSDALAVSSLATKEDIPVVMVRNNGDNTSLQNSIVRWKISEAIAVGGVNSISEKTLESAGTEKTSRIAGRNRFETAMEIAKKSYSNPEAVFVGNGDVMIDALSAGAVTYKAKAPIVLAQKNSMSDSVKKYLKGIKNIMAIGGEKTIDIK